MEKDIENETKLCACRFLGGACRSLNKQNGCWRYVALPLYKYHEASCGASSSFYHKGVLAVKHAETAWFQGAAS